MEASIPMRTFRPFLLSVFCIFLLPPAYAEEERKEISIEELTESRAAELFRQENYEEALKEFEELGRQFPEDPLPPRYVGMILALLGRLDEAVAIFQKALEKSPDNSALRYFLAITYHEQGADRKAQRELEEVIRLDPEGFYGRPAKEARPRVREIRFRPKRWNVFGSTGYEYDSNVTLEPNDKGVGSFASQNANRFFFALGADQTWFERGSFLSRIAYRANQSIHDDTLSEFNFTFQEFSIDNQVRSKFFGREVRWGFRYSLPVGFLDGDLFSLGNEITPSVNARLTPNSRTEIYHRYSHFEFGPDGQTPRLTSRDGHYHAAGIFQTFYFSNFLRYVFAGYEFDTSAARGDNFDRVGHGFQAGLHTPLFAGWALDLSGGFTAAHYPHFSAELVAQETLARRDENWTFLASLTRPLGRNWTFRTYYRTVNANNRNDVYQYDRQIGGVEFLFRY